MRCPNCNSNRVFQVPETAFESFCANCDLQFDIRGIEVEAKLAKALYALNGILPDEDRRENLNAIERMDMNKLIVARDYIWSQLQAINPNNWKD